MKQVLVLLTFFSLFSVRASVPDTTNIPAKWKNESIIVLKQRYSVEEITSGKFQEKFYCAYLVKDKYALKQLSTLNIPNEIVADKEAVIGKIYKKESTLDITSKHLTTRSTKVGRANRKNAANSAAKFETSQKLAIPTLAVGDILEIEYTANRQDFPEVVYLSTKYPAVHLEFYAAISADFNPYYKIGLVSKAINCQGIVVGNTDRSVSVSRDMVDKIKAEPLTEDNHLYPYVLMRKNYTPYGVTSSVDTKYQHFDAEMLQTKQLNLVRTIYEQGDKAQKRTARKIAAYLDKKYPVINDTIAYVNEAFFYYRELIAANTLYNSDAAGSVESKNDFFFVNVMSRVLFRKRIAYYAFLTQPDYFGDPLAESDLIAPHYGIYLPGKEYFVFSPAVYTMPGQVPANYENQWYVKFAANKHFKPYHYAWGFWLFPPAGAATLPLTLPPYIVSATRAKKYRKFGFYSEKFPISKPEDNLTKSEIVIDNFNTKNNTCSFNLKYSYWGKNKNRFTKSICSNTLLYETETNNYRNEINKTRIVTSAAESQNSLHNKYLKKFLQNDVENEGYNLVSLKTFSVDETNFFNPQKPFVTNCTFEAKDIIFSFENYIILNVGSIIGNQLLIQSSDSVRQNDFRIPFKKKYSFVIRVEIPAGYKVEDISQLNQKYQSFAGSFVTEAKVKGNSIEIRTDKTYDFLNYDKEDYKDVTGFIELAENFSKKKILLRKS